MESGIRFCVYVYDNLLRLLPFITINATDDTVRRAARTFIRPRGARPMDSPRGEIFRINERDSSVNEDLIRS